MAHLRDEPPRLCWLCEKNEATEPYVRGKQTRMVCATCLEKNRARDALEDRLIYFTDLELDGQYDAALACLDEILEANRHHDHDLWMARSIAMHRSAILFRAGRHAEAEQACEAWTQLGFRDVWDRWFHSSIKARTLDALGRPREALAVLEEALGYRDPKYLPSVMMPLVDLVEISEKLGQPVDPKWRPLAEAVAKRYRAELPAADSLAKAILELDEITRTRNPKFPDEWKKDELEGGEP